MSKHASGRIVAGGNQIPSSVFRGSSFIQFATDSANPVTLQYRGADGAWMDVTTATKGISNLIVCPWDPDNPAIRLTGTVGDNFHIWGN